MFVSIASIPLPSTRTVVFLTFLSWTYIDLLAGFYYKTSSTKSLLLHIYIQFHMKFDICAVLHVFVVCYTASPSAGDAISALRRSSTVPQAANSENARVETVAIALS